MLSYLPGELLMSPCRVDCTDAFSATIALVLSVLPPPCGTTRQTWVGLTLFWFGGQFVVLQLGLLNDQPAAGGVCGLVQSGALRLCSNVAQMNSGWSGVFVTRWKPTRPIVTGWQVSPTTPWIVYMSLGGVPVNTGQSALSSTEP